MLHALLLSLVCHFLILHLYLQVECGILDEVIIVDKITIAKLSLFYRVKRLDYDVAIGVNGQTSKDIAVREVDQPTEPMPYGNNNQFALWCKTLLNPTVDWTAASALAAARMMGRVWAWVSDIGELTRGDHIAWKSGKLYYYQHAIVTGIDGIVITGAIPELYYITLKFFLRWPW